MSDLGLPPLPPQRSVPAERWERRQALLECHVASSFRSIRKAWWRRKRVMVPGVAVAVTCLAAAGWGLRPAGLAERSTEVGCYAAVSLQSDTAIIGGAGADPVGACREVWRQSGREPVGDAVACLRDNGSIAVFPARNACRTLDLRPYVGMSEVAQRFAAFQEDAITVVTADPCRSRSEIIAVLRQKLGGYGFGSWSIDDSGFDQPWARDRPCVSLAFDHDRSTVLIVPSSRQ